MVFPGHLAGGYLATKALLVLSHASFSPVQTAVIYMAGIISSEGPDLDLLWFYIVHKFRLGNDQSHRDYLTHAPVIWLAGGLIISAAGLFSHSTLSEFIGLAVLCGSWSHFILDSIEYGIMWLWPFSRKRYAIIVIPEEAVTDENAGSISYYWKYIRTVYIKNITFYLEIIIIIAAIMAAVY